MKLGPGPSSREVNVEKRPFDVILFPFEGKVLSGLASVKAETFTRVVHEQLGDPSIKLCRVHTTLGRLAGFGLVTRTAVSISGSYGPEHRVLWKLSPAGERFLGIQ